MGGTGVNWLMFRLLGWLPGSGCGFAGSSAGMRAARCGRSFEQVDGLTRRRLRSTDGLRQSFTQIGLALAGRAGVRLAAVLGMVTSRSTLLRLVRALQIRPSIR